MDICVHNQPVRISKIKHTSNQSELFNIVFWRGWNKPSDVQTTQFMLVLALLMNQENTLFGSLEVTSANKNSPFCSFFIYLCFCTL